MCALWKKDADRVLEPDVNGFTYKCFERAPELIDIGESAARAIVPELRALLNLADPAQELASALTPVTSAVSPAGIVA